MKNPKNKLSIAIIVLFTVLFIIGIRSQQNECDCMKWKHFKTVTILPTAELFVQPDSVCITEGYRDGKIINKSL